MKLLYLFIGIFIGGFVMTFLMAFFNINRIRYFEKRCYSLQEEENSQ